MNRGSSSLISVDKRLMKLQQRAVTGAGSYRKQGLRGCTLSLYGRQINDN